MHFLVSRERRVTGYPAGQPTIGIFLHGGICDCVSDPRWGAKDKYVYGCMFAHTALCRDCENPAESPSNYSIYLLPEGKIGWERWRGAAFADGILHHIPLTCFIWLAESVGHGMQIVRLPPPAFALPGLAPPVGALPALAGAPPAKKVHSGVRCS